MIVVNTTFHVESSIAKEWVAWVHATYLVNAVERCSMSSPLFMKILTQMEGGEGYAVQLQCESDEATERWLNEQQPRLLAEMRSRWGERALFFTTLMEEVRP